MSDVLLSASFVSRPNRFLVTARLSDGRRVRAHLADPGRLRELLVPGAVLRLRPATDPRRRTRYTVVLVRAVDPPRAWVSVDTTLPNHLAGELLSAGRPRGVGRGWSIRREVTGGRSRFDFLLSRPDGTSMLVEVKSVSLVEGGIARFPDAPTLRGARHVRELESHVREGGRALVLFVVQRHDARAVAPHRATDPDFAAALESAARSGVLLRAVAYRLDSRGRAYYRGSLPVRLRQI